MSQFVIDVSISPNIEDVRHEELRCAVKDAISEHVRERSGLIDDLHVDAMVSECFCRDGLAGFTITVAGEVNGRRLSRQIRATRSPGNLRRAGVGTAFGLGRVVNLVVVGLATNAFGVGDDANNISQCIGECLAEVELTIDDLLGHAESAASNAWKWIVPFRWFAALASFALLLLIFAALRGVEKIGPAVFAGIFLSVSVFGFIHVVALASMPASFFLHDPRGKKALTRVGVTSVGSVRAICVVLAIIFLGVIACCILASIEFLNKPPAH